MKFLKRFLLFFAILILLTSIGLYSVYRLRILPDRVAGIYSSFAAKEGCSCVFVVRAPEEYCKDYVRRFFQPDVWILEKDSIQIEFRSFFSTFVSKASFEESQGCRLLP
ncbi:hypothetical protein [Leptospira wolffii]|uniref:hypothetical protein n=1 Tax=Leptospira wolffii TaxID=409998 RepID=UPI00030D462B|nr:hypothetical protein [Leptospira wolffii]EPG67350.1 hypothetical protein LEP1GSC061_1158 [Leptospira wolffii serovar Khorat str. Khorat-H2]